MGNTVLEFMNKPIVFVPAIVISTITTLYFMSAGVLTQRELIMAQDTCKARGQEAIINLDHQQGLKQAYSVHCKTPTGFDLIVGE